MKLTREALLYSNQNFAITMRILESPEADDTGRLRKLMAENTKKISAQIARIKAYGIAPGEEQELTVSKRQPASASRKKDRRAHSHHCAYGACNKG